MRRGLAVGIAAWLPALTALAAACGEEPKDPPRYLDEGSFVPDASADARAEHYVPCDPSDPACRPDAASDAPEAGDAGGACPAEGACSSAPLSASICGDTNNEQRTFTGARSEWLSVRVPECSTGMSFGAAMKATLTLQSPPGENFDLFAYYDPLADAAKCTAASASSTQQAGISDAVSVTWGEGSVPNGSDDSRTIVIEVRHVSGACDPGAKWSLLVQGNE